MRIAFVFPGQGEQKVGMGRDIYEAYPEKRHIFDRAGEILGENIKELCFQGPYEDLIDSRKSGLAVFLVSYMIYEIMKDLPTRPSGYAGYSLGQYAALCAAGAFPFEDAVKLVSFRGECLKKGASERNTGMVGVIGVPEKAVEETARSLSGAYLANYNSPGNYTISYDKSIKERLISAFEKQNAMKLTDIPVAGGWHSPFMKNAADMFRDQLFMQPMELPRGNFVENHTAGPVKSVGYLKENLYHHIYSPVRWYQSVRKLRELGTDTFVEIGFGNQLSKFIKFTDRKARVLSTGTAEDLERTVRVLRIQAGNPGF